LNEHANRNSLNWKSSRDNVPFFRCSDDKRGGRDGGRRTNYRKGFSHI